MNTLFQLTVYTGHQLALEGLQRWLRRSCQDAEQRQRRTSLKSLIVLLAKTAATGVLATVLDAAIEYRRRQIVAAASQSEDDLGVEPSGRFPFNLLSRAGISAWKARLLIGIDELERQAERYGIEPTHRFCEGKLVSEGENKRSDESPQSSSRADDEEARERVLAKTVEQLRSLVKDGEEAAELLDHQVESFLDLLVGSVEQRPKAKPQSRSLTSACSSSSSIVTADQDDTSMGTPVEEPECGAVQDHPASTTTTCQICMDCHVRVKVDVCQHMLCFRCARRICESQDHHVPHCPFCRQTIDGFAPC